MADIHGTIHAPILKLIAQEVLALVKSDYALRALQGAQAPQACYFDRQTLGAGSFVNIPYAITQARSGGNEIFTSLVVTFDTASGLGFYRVDGQDPTTTVGIEIPAGGGILQINGHNNIKNFAMINQAATTLPFARVLYK